MSLSEAELITLYERVRGLKLRIQKTPQVTAWIRQEADRIAAPLEAIEKKLNQRRQSASQYAHIESVLLTVQRQLHSLFQEYLNPLMGNPVEESLP